MGVGYCQGCPEKHTCAMAQTCVRAAKIAAGHDIEEPFPSEQERLIAESHKLGELIKQNKEFTNIEHLIFSFTSGEGGSMGYVSTVRREDAVRLIMEWLAKSFEMFTDESFLEMLELFKKERGL